MVRLPLPVGYEVIALMDGWLSLYIYM